MLCTICDMNIIGIFYAINIIYITLSHCERFGLFLRMLMLMLSPLPVKSFFSYQLSIINYLVGANQGKALLNTGVPKICYNQRFSS